MSNQRTPFLLLVLVLCGGFIGCLPTGPHVRIDLPEHNAAKALRVKAYRTYRSRFSGDYCKVYSHSSWEDEERDTEECRRWKEKRPKWHEKYCLRKVEKRHYRYTPMSHRSYCKGQRVSYRDVPTDAQGSTLRLNNGQEIVHPRDLLAAVFTRSTTAKAVRAFYEHHENGNRAGLATTISFVVFLSSFALLPALDSMPPFVLPTLLSVTMLSTVISGSVTIFQYLWRDQARGRAFAHYERDLRERLDLRGPLKPLLKPRRIAP